MFKALSKAVSFILFLAAGHPLSAATLPKGADPLRELIVFSEINLEFNLGFATEANEWVIREQTDPAEAIAGWRELVKAKPDDVHALLSLGGGLADNNQTNESAACFQKAEQLCRARLSASPQSGRAMIDLGAALAGRQKNEEAEKFFREATQVSSNDWRCWTAYGHFLVSQVVPDDRSSSAAELVLAGKKMDEAAHCFSVAQTIAPNDPDVYLQCAGQASYTAVLTNNIQRFKNGSKPDPGALSKAMTCEAVITNLMKAAQLDPKNSRYPALMAFFRFYKYISQPGRANAGSGHIPDEVRQPMVEMKTRLEGIAADPDKSIATAALEYLGFINLLMGNSSEARTYEQRAVALDPKRDHIYDLLLLASTPQTTHEEIVKICQSRLDNKPSARNHLILACAYQRQKKWTDVGTEAAAALKLEPKNLTAHLVLAAVDLKLSVDPVYMDKATDEFKQTYKLIGESQMDRIVPILHDFYLDLAIYIYLYGAPDNKETAKRWVNSVLQSNPEDEQARAILSAID